MDNTLTHNLKQSEIESLIKSYFNKVRSESVKEITFEVFEGKLKTKVKTKIRK